MCSITFGRFAIVRHGTYPPVVVESVPASDPRTHERGVLDDGVLEMDFLPWPIPHSPRELVWRRGESEPRWLVRL